MRNSSLKRLPVRARVLAAVALALSLAALVVFPLAHPAQAHAADPAVLTVTKTTDTDQEGTLRWALNQVKAGAGTRIEFNTTAMSSSVIELTSQLPAIESAVGGVEIEIAGPASGVTIKKASTAPMPGGWRHLRIISTQEFDVSISNVTFEGPGDQGALPQVVNGGIYVDSGFPGSLKLTDCTLEGNRNNHGKDPDATQLARGGAIHVLSNLAELHMSNCEVRDNIAYSYGGGVHSHSPVFAEGCQFSENFSLDSSLSGSVKGGGALLSEQAELTGCTVDGNHSDGDAGGVQSDDLTMTDCTVTNNTAGASGLLSAGGGVGAKKLVMTGCEVKDNKSTDQGGGIYSSGSATITGSTVSGNASKSIGGGVFIVRTGVVQSSKILENTSDKMGAGVAVGDGTAEHEASTLTVVDSPIKGNKSLEGGGGIFMYDNCALTLTDATVSNNESKLSGGGIHGQNTASLNMTGGQISGNKTSATDGHGGGVFLENGDAVLERCLVSGNTAAESGGGLLVSGLTARDVQLSRNVAGAVGGGAFAASLEAIGSTFDGNTANSGGGLLAPDVALTNCTVFGNTVKNEGGGVAGTRVELANCTVSGNVCGAVAAPMVAGGGVLANKLSMNGSIVAGNYDKNDNPSELVVGTKVDNGNGTLADSHGKKNIVGVPASGLGTILKTQTVSGREVAMLENNGGTTPTIMIAPDGPAQDIVAEGDYAVPKTDQRGTARPAGPMADIGAVEVSGLKLTYSVEAFDVYRGGDQPLTGKAEAPLRSVLGVQMDGTDLEPGKHYELAEGSTVITLLPAYLKTLKSGTYDVVVSFTNGHATLPLTVELPKPKPVDLDDSDPEKSKPLAPTGDDAGPFSAALALVAVSAAAVALGVTRRRLS